LTKDKEEKKENDLRRGYVWTSFSFIKKGWRI